MPCFDNVMPGPGALHLNNGKLVLQGGIENANAGVSAAALLYEMRQYASNTAAHASIGRWPDAAADSGQEPSNTTWQGLAFDAAEAAERLRLFDLNAPAPSADEPGEWGGATSHDGRPRARFMPFVSRLLVRRDTTVVMFGDLHGSLHSLLRILAGLRERGMLSEDLSIAPSFRGGKLVLAFLGDFVDRGAYGAEVMATLLRLHRANAGPKLSGGTSDGGGGLGSIWLLRGNHEDPRMNVHGSFRGELLRKYGGRESGGAAELAGLDGVMLAAAASWDVPRDTPGTAADQLLGAVGRLYEMLPVALFLGVQGADTLAASLGSHAEQEDGTPPLFGACSGKALEKGWCGDASAVHGSYVMGCHGGIELGFNARPLLLHPSARSHEAAPGLRSLFWPITGLFRAQWLASRAGWTRPHIPEGHFTDITSAQAAPVAGWGASPAAMGPAGYPTPPSAVHPGLGFLWSDFFVDDEERVMGWTPGRGPVFGKALTRHWLEDSGVAAVVRAHQHHDSPISGDCLSKMRRNGGWAPHWGGDGSVTTFVSASGIPGLGLAHDGVGVLSLAGLRPAEWSLAHCSNKVGEQVATLQDGRRIGGEESSAPAMDDAGIRPAITHACDPSYRLECEPLPWVGHKAEYRPGKGEPLPPPLQGETGLPVPARQSNPEESSPDPVGIPEQTADEPALDAGLEADPADTDAAPVARPEPTRAASESTMLTDFTPLDDAAGDAAPDTAAAPDARSRTLSRRVRQQVGWQSPLQPTGDGEVSDVGEIASLLHLAAHSGRRNGCGGERCGSEEPSAVTSVVILQPEHGGRARLRSMTHTLGTAQFVAVQAEVHSSASAKGRGVQQWEGEAGVAKADEVGQCPLGAAAGKDAASGAGEEEAGVEGPVNAAAESDLSSLAPRCRARGSDEGQEGSEVVVPAPHSVEACLLLLRARVHKPAGPDTGASVARSQPAGDSAPATPHDSGLGVMLASAGEAARGVAAQGSAAGEADGVAEELLPLPRGEVAGRVSGAEATSDAGPSGEGTFGEGGSGAGSGDEEADDEDDEALRAFVAQWEAVGSMQCKPLRFGEDGAAAVRFRAVVSRGDTAAAVVLEHSGPTRGASLALPALPAPGDASRRASAGSSKPWAAVVAARAVGEHRWLAWEASVFETTDE